MHQQNYPYNTLLIEIDEEKNKAMWDREGSTILHNRIMRITIMLTNDFITLETTYTFVCATYATVSSTGNYIERERDRERVHIIEKKTNYYLTSALCNHFMVKI